jgi:hypothetical protein
MKNFKLIQILFITLITYFSISGFFIDNKNIDNKPGIESTEVIKAKTFDISSKQPGNFVQTNLDHSKFQAEKLKDYLFKILSLGYNPEAEALTRFWVGGTGSWDAATTTHWAATSGGAGGQSVPTSSDTVTFDSASNATLYTVTITATANCSDLSISAPASGAVTWAGSSSLVISGSVFVSATNVTRTFTGPITLSSTTTGKTIDINQTLASSLTISGAGGGWTLSNNLNTGTSSVTYSSSGGTLNTNGKTLTIGSFNAATNTKTLTLGASSINITSSWAVNAADTVSAASSTITASAGTSFSGGGETYGTVNWTTVASGAWTGANSYTTLTITGGAVTTGQITFDSNQTISGTFTCNGNSNANSFLIASDTIGTARTITANAVSLRDMDFRDITGAGAATWSGTRITNAGGNSNITFATPFTRYWVAVGGGTWSATSSWSSTSGGGSGSSVPRAHDAVIMDANSFTSAGTITWDVPRVGSVNASAATFAARPNWTVGVDFNGDVDLSTLQPFTSGPINFRNRTSITYKSPTIGSGTLTTINIECPGGTVTLGGNLVNNGALVITYGTFDASSFNVNPLGGVTSNNSNVRSIIIGTGQWTVSGNGGGEWDTSTATNLTRTLGTNPIKFTYSGSSGTRTILQAANESTAFDVWISAGTDIVTATSAHNLSFSGFNGTVTNSVRSIYGDLTLSSGGSFSITGSNLTTFATTSGTQSINSLGATLDVPVTINATGATVQAVTNNLTFGSTRTFTLTNGTFDGNGKNISIGLFSSTNSNTRVLTQGAGTWTLSGNNGTLWNTTTTTGFTLNRSSDFICNYSLGVGTRTIATSTLSEANAPGFDISAGSDIVDITTNVYNLDFTGFTGTLNLDARTVYGSLTLSSGMSPTAGTSITTFSGTSGTQVITSNTKTIDFPLTFNGIGGTFQLGDAVTVGTATSRTIALTAGTLDLNGKTLTHFGQFSVGSGSSTRVLNFNSGTIDLKDTATQSIWTYSGTNFSTSGVGTIKISGSTANIRTFAGGGATYSNIWFTNATANGGITFTGSNNFQDIKCLDTNIQTIKFTVGTTTHVTSFSVVGAASNLIIINSTTTGTFAIVKDTGGILCNVSMDYVDIQHMVATPANTWYAGINSTNHQATATAGSGVSFTAAPGCGGLYLRFLYKPNNKIISFTDHVKKRKRVA